jgi:hypothetical protein
LGSVSSLVSEKKIFEISANQSILLALAKCSNAFFSETTNMIKAKLYMNVHWMVLYNFKVFCSDMKFKMAATAGLRQKLGKGHSNDHSFTVWVQSVH